MRVAMITVVTLMAVVNVTLIYVGIWITPDFTFGQRVLLTLVFSAVISIPMCFAIGYLGGNSNDI